MTCTAKRITLTCDPFGVDHSKPWYSRGIWPARWITLSRQYDPPFVAAYRNRFSLDAETTLRIHVTADQRYDLFLDGIRIGWGSERGDEENWFFETYELTLTPGSHVLVARTWTWGDLTPYYQRSICPGLLVAADERHSMLLSTGRALWEGKILDGYHFYTWRCVDPPMQIDGRQFAWGFESGEGDGWVAARMLHEGCNGAIRNETPGIHQLKPASLPPMREQIIVDVTVRYVSSASCSPDHPIPIRKQDDLPAEHELWSKALHNNSVTIPPHTFRRVLYDLGNYYCYFPQIHVTAGRQSRVTFSWAEALFRESAGEQKGNRNEVFDLYVYGPRDTYIPDGGRWRRFEPLYWRSGRYVELQIETHDDPLVFCGLSLRETRYPLAMESRIESPSTTWNQVIPLAVRSLQMCSHETLMDCPYYEQLMYLADARLELLGWMAITRDCAMIRKTLTLFDASRLPNGLTQSRYPSRVRQVIPPFSLWWVGMLHDYAFWRNDPDFVRALLPSARNVIDGYLRFLNKDGLIEGLPGWNFMDWVPDWPLGVPPQGECGVSAMLNWQFVYTLSMMANLEQAMGERELCERCCRLAHTLSARLIDMFWDPNVNLFADDLSRRSFSEHTQCLAILAETLEPEHISCLKEAMTTYPSLSKATIYFSHYLFEAFQKMRAFEAIEYRLSAWFNLVDFGFRTTPERPEPSRSDCHGWSSHVIYHYFATILGVRPGNFGFTNVVISPQLGTLNRAGGSLVHPKGLITTCFEKSHHEMIAAIHLPDGIEGTLHLSNQTIPLGSASRQYRVALA